uniref:Uncharacterized protein n=1 Tax=Anopheles atroparvus TaxID=41427 RepID=A0AAG5DAB8_ANOAO
MRTVCSRYGASGEPDSARTVETWRHNIHTQIAFPSCAPARCDTVLMPSAGTAFGSMDTRSVYRFDGYVCAWPNFPQK